MSPPHIAPAAAFAFDPTLYASKRPAEPDDWLTSHHETPEGFEPYVKKGPVRPTAARHTIVLQPLGPFTPDEAAGLETLREYVSIFFQLDARVAPPLPLPTLGWRTVGHGVFAFVQYRTDILLEQVLRPRLPADAICYLGVTMADLYPAPSWSYVFGWASFEERVGVYSLDRYRPHYDGEPDTPATRRRTLRRQLKVLVHEAAHMFSLPHCTRYECVMNGADSVEELDRNVPWPCPVCLRKLQWNMGFDVRRRDLELRAFYARRDMAEEVEWLDRRLARLDGDAGDAGAAD
jgi:archaemetzincin